MPPAVLASIALGSTAASLYGTKKAAEQNRRALEAQERDSERAVSEGGKDRELSVQDMANQQARLDRAMAADEKRWQDYLEVQRPHWNIGAGALGRLTELAGLPGGGSGAPNVQMPSGPTAGAQPPVAGGPVDARLMTLAGAPPPVNVSGAPVSTAMPVRPSRRGRALFEATRRPAPPVAGPAQGMSTQSLMQLAAMFPST